MVSEIDSFVYCKTTMMSESILLFIILRIFDFKKYEEL